MSSNYTLEELVDLLAYVGERVHIHKSVQFFNPKQISIGSNVRIDCYSILSAGSEGIMIGNHVHVAAATHLFGSGGRIVIEDFANLSSRVSLFTASDDYKEGFLTNPTIPMDYKKVEMGPITISRHGIIGCGSVLLPSVHIGLGAAVGALSLIKHSVQPFQIVAGIPARVVGERSNDCLNHEKNYLESSSQYL